MFTGIIREVEKVKSVRQKGGSLFAEVSLPKDWHLVEGQSISINGICSTVRAIGKTSFEVEYMPETISKTTVSKWTAGLSVNLEQSLRLNDFVDGHLVQGHVDTTGEILKIEKKGDSKVFHIKIPKEFNKFIVSKGSVALDGVSLTVASVSKNTFTHTPKDLVCGFTVSLVSYTLEHTNFNEKKVGESVNIETDIIAKYIYAKKGK